MIYVIRDREAGNPIEFAETLEAAEAIISQYEETDRRDNIYTPDFYEFVEMDID